MYVHTYVLCIYIHMYYGHTYTHTLGSLMNYVHIWSFMYGHSYYVQANMHAYVFYIHTYINTYMHIMVTHVTHVTFVLMKSKWERNTWK